MSIRARTREPRLFGFKTDRQLWELLRERPKSLSVSTKFFSGCKLVLN